MANSAPAVTTAAPRARGADAATRAAIRSDHRQQQQEGQRRYGETAAVAEDEVASDPDVVGLRDHHQCREEHGAGIHPKRGERDPCQEPGDRQVRQPREQLAGAGE